MLILLLLLMIMTTIKNGIVCLIFSTELFYTTHHILAIMQHSFLLLITFNLIIHQPLFIFVFCIIHFSLFKTYTSWFMVYGLWLRI